MALAVTRALHAQSLRFPSSPSLLSHPPSRALPTTHAPSLSSPKPATSVVGLRRHVVARAAVSDFGPSTGDILGNVSIFTAAGEPVLFKDLWDQNEGIAVVAPLRHFGCFCCWELASSIKEAKERFDSAGVKLVAVGVGTPDKARILADRKVLNIREWKSIRSSLSDKASYAGVQIYCPNFAASFVVPSINYGLSLEFSHQIVAIHEVRLWIKTDQLSYNSLSLSFLSLQSYRDHITPIANQRPPVMIFSGGGSSSRPV